MPNAIIIVGAGLAGWSTAREFRKLDSTTPVLLISADSGDFYAKPSLSNAFAQQRSPAQLVTTAAATMARSLNVTLLADNRVTAIDSATRTVRSSKGDFPYRQLVLATGAQAIRVPVAGDAADQVMSINALEDFAELHGRLTGSDRPAGNRHVMIMGAGLIGCEFANDLAGAGYQVSVADPADGPMAALLPAQAGAALRDALAGLGVSWHFGTSVRSVSRNAAGAAPPPLQVELANGHRAEVDAVLSAIGLRADTRLARAAGLLCDRGIVVDDHLQTSVPNIYALGDAAQYANGRTMPYVMPIMHAARALAATLAGTPAPVQFPLMPVAIKTPALPLLVAPPAPGVDGQWQQAESGVWRFMDPAHAVRGFAAMGEQARRRVELARQVVA